MMRVALGYLGAKQLPDEYPDYEGPEEGQDVDPARIEREWATSPLVRQVTTPEG